MIDLVPDDDQQTIAEVAAKAFAPLFDRPTADLSADEFAGLAELSVFSLALPEAFGGVELGLAEQAMVALEAGATLAPLSILATMVAADLAAAQGNAELVEQLTSGAVRVGWAEPWTWSPNAVTTWRTIDADAAEFLLAATPAGLELVPTGDFSIEPVDGALDLGSALGRATRTGAAGTPDAAALARARVLVAAAATGAARRTMEEAVEYAKNREQFNKPIGSFQAVKHMCADMAIAFDSAHAAVFLAAVSIDAGVGAPDEATVALVAGAEAATRTAELGVQVYGGIGVTWECDAHRFVRRAAVTSQLLGPNPYHYEELLDSALARLEVAS